jgi:hypothetical protein
MNTLVIKSGQNLCRSCRGKVRDHTAVDKVSEENIHKGEFLSRNASDKENLQV